MTTYLFAQTVVAEHDVAVTQVLFPRLVTTRHLVRLVPTCQDENCPGVALSLHHVDVGFGVFDLLRDIR